MRVNKWIIIALLVIGAIVSFTAVASKASDPKTYEKTIEKLDEKKDNVLKLTAAATTSSAVLTALPDDICTPIAEKLADMSGYFLVVLCAIYLEKYLLTIIGMASFRILIPLGLLLLAIYFLKGNFKCRKIGFKLIAFGFAIFLVIPTSIMVSTKIEDTYADTMKVTQVIEENQKDSKKNDQDVEEEGTKAAPSEEATPNGLFDTFTEGVKAITDGAANLKDEAGKIIDQTTDGATEKVTGLIKNQLDKVQEDAQSMLNNFIEAAAVMIITSCAIPLLVLLFFFWIVKIILDIDISMPDLGSFRKK